MGVREAYLARCTALKQFKFVDPLVSDFYTVPKPYNQILFNKNNVVFSQVLNTPLACSLSFMMLGVSYNFYDIFVQKAHDTYFDSFLFYYSILLHFDTY
jgi:hypothetical protein